MNPLLFILGALFALPHGRLTYVAWLVLALIAISALLKKHRVSPLVVIGLAVYAFGVSLSLINDTADGTQAAFLNHVALPALFFALGASYRAKVPAYIAGYGLVSVALGLWTINQTDHAAVYDAVAGAWDTTGERRWVHPITSDVVSATAINGACLVAGIGGLMAVEAKGWLRWLLASGAAGFVYIAVQTQTRGAIAAVLFAACVLVLKASRKVKVAAACAGVGLLAVAGSLPERFGLDYQTDVGLTGRVDIWRERLADVLAYPWGVKTNYEGHSCHNEYIEVGYLYGVLPALGFLLAVVVCGLRAWSQGALGAAFLAVAIHAFTDSHIVSSPATFWVMVLLMGAMTGRAK